MGRKNTGPPGSGSGCEGLERPKLHDGNRAATFSTCVHGLPLIISVGLAAVFAASEMAFTVLKWCGAAYLVYLAWGAWRAPISVKDDGDDQPAAVAESASAGDFLRMVMRGVVMNLTNPKVLIFFLAFLPQFANPALGPVAPQIFAFGAVFILATFLVFGAIAIFSGVFGKLLLKSAKGQWWLNKITALVFVGLAVKLATSQR